MPLADTLDLTRRGPAQVDRVLVNPATVRVDDPGAGQTANFLRQIEQLSSTVGGVLAKRAAERKAEEERQLSEQARLKATNPTEWQRRVEAGEVKESDHPAFHRAYNVYAAQDAAAKAEAEFRAFDVEANDDEAVANFAASARQRYLAENDSVIYQGAMAEALNGLEANLRGRRQQVVSAQQTERTYLNFQSSLHDSITDAVRQGRPAEVAGVVAQQLDRGVAGGLSLSKLLTHVANAAEEAVSANPDVADELASIPLPHVGPGATLGSFASAQLAQAQARAFDARERAARLAITQQERAERQAARAARRAAAQEVFANGTVSPETQAALFRSDPEFALRLPEMMTKANDAAIELDPDFQEYRAAVALGEKDLDDVEARFDAGHFGFRQYEELSKLAQTAQQRGDLTKRPGFKSAAESVERTVKAGISAMTASGAADPITGKAVKTPLSSAAQLAVEEARSRVSTYFRQKAGELAAAGADEAAFERAAAEARELWTLEADSIARQYGLGEHREAPVTGPAAEVAGRPKRRKVAPQVLREANEVLDGPAVAALDRLGGFHVFADQAEVVPQVAAAMEAYTTSGQLTPWAREQYAAFVSQHPDLGLDEAGFMMALFYTVLPDAPTSGSE